MVDELLEELRELTVRTIQQINEMSAEQLSEFVDQRERIVAQLQQIELTIEEREAYRELVNDILSLDSVIRSKIEEYRAEASQELTRMNLSKRQRSRYESESAPYSEDGLFFDSKK